MDPFMQTLDVEAGGALLAIRIVLLSLQQPDPCLMWVQLWRAVFVTDSQILQRAVTSQVYDSAPLGALFREVKVRLHLNFTETCVIYNSRTCNGPAHILAARGAAEQPGYSYVWYENFPVDVTRRFCRLLLMECQRSI